MPKRILFISESVDFMSGAEKSMLEVVSLLKGRFECYAGMVKSEEFKKEIAKIGVKQIDVCLHENNGLIRYARNMIKTIKLLRKNNIDLIYITSSGNYWKPAEIIAAKLAGVPVVTHMRWWKYRLDSFLKYSDKIICNSKFTSEKLMKSKLGKKTEVVMNFVDFEKLNVRKIKHKGINVSYIGQISPVKGIKYLIDAAKTAKKANFLIVGRDAGAYPGYLDEMKEYAKGTSNVKFIDYTSDVSSTYNKTDIFVLPSLEEPFGRVLAEAGYFEIPCVASNAGGIPEVIEDGETGILVKPKNADMIADAIKRLSKDKSLREKMGKKAKERIMNKFNPEKQTNKIEKICNKLIKK